MDFNSGSLPLQFIRFYLDMASEEQITEATLPITEGSETTRETGNAPKNPVVTSRPDSNQSTSSGNTEDSLTLLLTQVKLRSCMTVGELTESKTGQHLALLTRTSYQFQMTSLSVARQPQKKFLPGKE